MGNCEGLRRLFVLGSPRSRTTVVQTVLAQACDLATMASTNWWLEHRITRVLNGDEGMSRAQARPFAIQRICAHVAAATGIVLPEPFRIEDALDRLALETGAVGWLEKTPMHVLAIPEIERDVPHARFVHVIREPAAVLRSLIRRARANPGMIGAAFQSRQKNGEAVWRACVHATLQQHGKPQHLVIDSEAFVADPEADAVRVATLLDIDYRTPNDPGRVRAAQAARPSPRPWKSDATGPVRRITHADQIPLEPLDTDTVMLWEHAQHTLSLARYAAKETPGSPTRDSRS